MEREEFEVRVVHDETIFDSDSRFYSKSYPSRCHGDAVPTPRPLSPNTTRPFFVL